VEGRLIPGTPSQSQKDKRVLNSLPGILKENLTGKYKKPFLLLFQAETWLGHMSDPSCC
jgi:hypothetical protein